MLRRSIVAEKSSTSSALNDSKGSSMRIHSKVQMKAKKASVPSKGGFAATLDFFQRLRYRKRDKIKAHVDQKIRAVRAAEALDRQTNLRRGMLWVSSAILIDKHFCLHFAHVQITS